MRVGDGSPWLVIVGTAMVRWLCGFGSKERREHNERERREEK